MWKAESIKELKVVIDEMEEEWMIKTLTEKGYHISTTKELDNGPIKSHYQAFANSYKTDSKKNTITDTKSQVERYSMHDIKELYGYDNLIIQYREKRQILISFLKFYMIP